jgi:dTDP-4-dehydrorhamnose reductase
MRALLTGATGFLGSHLWPLLEREHELLTVARQAIERELHVQGDLEDPGTFERLSRFSPDVVIHLAGAGDADLCQREPERARRGNVALTSRFADAVSGCRRFVFASTDLVFDGSRGGYDERSEPSPLSVYGATKLEGERVVRDVLGDRATVVRLAVLYGARCSATSRASFAETLVRSAASGTAPTLFTDEFRSPLYVEDAALGLATLAASESSPRLLHFGGPDRRSRYELGLSALEVFGLPASCVLPGRRADAPLLAPRPRDVSLDSSLALSLGLRARGPREGLTPMKHSMERAGFMVGF